MSKRVRNFATDSVLAFLAWAAVLAGAWRGRPGPIDMRHLVVFMFLASTIGSGLAHALLALKDALVAGRKRHQALDVPSAPSLLLCSAQAIVRAGGGGRLGLDATIAFNMILESQRQVRRLEAVGVLPPLEAFTIHDDGKANYHKKEQN